MLGHPRTGGAGVPPDMFTLTWKAVQKIKKATEKRVTLVIMGLDNAGKSTLLNTLRGEKEAHTTPTIGFDPETTRHGPYILTFFDLGGGKRIRGIWSRYFAEVHGAIYVVDSADEERIEEAKQALFDALGKETLQGKPVLILANKKDLPNALAADELAKRLGTEEIQCSWNILPCKAVTKMEEDVDTQINKGLKWLIGQVTKNYKALCARVDVDTAEQKRLDAIEKQAKKERVAKLRAERAAREKAEAEAEKAQSKAQPADAVLPPAAANDSENTAPQNANDMSVQSAMSASPKSTTLPMSSPRTPKMGHGEKLPPLNHPGAGQLTPLKPIQAVPRTPNGYTDVPVGGSLSGSPA